MIVCGQTAAIDLEEKRDNVCIYQSDLPPERQLEQDIRILTTREPDTYSGNRHGNLPLRPTVGCEFLVARIRTL